jgi:hypothetical protein
MPVEPSRPSLVDAMVKQYSLVYTHKTTVPNVIKNDVVGLATAPRFLIKKGAYPF